MLCSLKHRAVRALLWPLIGLVFLSLTPATNAAESEIWIVAHPSVPADVLKSSEVQRIFLLKTTVWKNGTPIVPVNREAASQERLRFSSVVLGVSIRSLSNYWNRMHFKGFMPPVVQESNAAMIAFVRNVPGAIGYITTDNIPEGVILLAKIQ